MFLKTGNKLVQFNWLHFWKLHFFNTRDWFYSSKFVKFSTLRISCPHTCICYLLCFSTVFLLFPFLLFLVVLCCFLILIFSIYFNKYYWLQVSATENELLSLRFTFDEIEAKTHIYGIVCEAGVLRQRHASLETEVKRFKIILLEASNRMKLRKNSSISRKTSDAIKSTVELINTIINVPKFLINTSKIDGLI